MPQFDFVRTVEVERTARVLQLEGLFDVPPTQQSQSHWSVSMPLDERPWQIGLIVGSSGSGKSTLAREAFADALASDYAWPEVRSLVDGFPADLGIKDITAALSSVGFSSPPSWLRPWRCLSTGEQFRANLARALIDSRPLVVVDEFTSVVDRTVAQIGSAAVAKAIRRTEGKQFVAVTCHFDVEEWLQPDWKIEMPNGGFAWRSLQRRPPIQLEIRRVHRSAWELFKHHHYLNTTLHKGAKCFLAFIGERPAAFASVLHAPGRKGGWWREHRTVCLPDFQGVGIGNRLSEFVASLFSATGKPYCSTTSHPSMIRHRLASKNWRMIRKPSLVHLDGGEKKRIGSGKMSRATNRLTAGFKFTGETNEVEARRFRII